MRRDTSCTYVDHMFIKERLASNIRACDATNARLIFGFGALNMALKL